MGALKHAGSYRDLVVYQKAVATADSIFTLTKTFPKAETYSLTDQMRRSSRSVGAQIAEAWAKRRYEAHFVSKLTDADAEQQETQHWIDTARTCGYLNDDQAAELRGALSEVGRMLKGMMQKASLFCGKSNLSVRESEAEYFVAGSNPDWGPVHSDQ